MPGGVSPEGRLVLAGCPLAVDLVLHHGDAVQLGAAPERQRGWGRKQRRKLKVSHEAGVKRLQKRPSCIAGCIPYYSAKNLSPLLQAILFFSTHLAAYLQLCSLMSC